MLSPDTRDGRSYSLVVAGALWPRHEVVTRVVRGGPRSWVFLPSPQRVRLVVPTERHAAAGALKSSAAGRPSSVRRAMLATSALLRLKSGSIVGPGFQVRPTRATDPGQAADRLLSELLDQPIRVSWTVGPARANRKPVLQIVGDQAGILAYAKAGIDPLTTSLVSRESTALASLERVDFSALVHPKVLGHFATEGTTMIVLAPLSTDGHSPDDVLDLAAVGARPTLEAMQEVSVALGRYVAEVSSSAWYDRLVARVRRIPQHERPPRLDLLMSAIAATRTRIPFGSWHGDWHAGNFATRGHEVAVWDWERLENHVPLGFDAQHLALQSLLRRLSSNFSHAASQVLATAPKRLAPWGISASQAELVAALHLVDLAVRYLEDGQLNAGAAVGAVDDWALPAAEAMLVPNDTREAP